MLLDEHAARFDDVLGLAVVEADGLDVFAQTLDAQSQYGFWGVGDRVELGSRLVDPYISCLGG